MELNHRVYELSVQANLEGQTVKVKLNGKEIEAGDKFVQAKHIFKKHYFETGKIVGWGILENYSVKDGFLVDKEGNQINFSSERFPDIKINKIRIPMVVFSEVEVDRQYVCDVASILNVEKPEELVKGLASEDKKAIRDEREARIAEAERKAAEEAEAQAKLKAEADERLAEEARKAEEEAKTAAEIKAAEEATRLAEEEAKKSEEERIKKEKEAEEARQAEEEAKAKAEETARLAEEAEKKRQEEEAARIAEEEKAYVITEKQYQTAKRRSEKSLGMKEYEKGAYRFFYAPQSKLPKNEKSFIVKKRPDGKYEELAGGLVLENEEEVEFEFEEIDGTEKTLILDLNNEEMTIDVNE